MRTVTLNIYKYCELDAAAQATAISDFCDLDLPPDWAANTITHVKHVCALLGFTVEHVHYTPKGEGKVAAAITGNYTFAPNALGDLQQFVPNSVYLHTIARKLYAVQRVYNQSLVGNFTLREWLRDSDALSPRQIYARIASRHGYTIKPADSVSIRECFVAVAYYAGDLLTQALAAVYNPDAIADYYTRYNVEFFLDGTQYTGE